MNCLMDDPFARSIDALQQMRGSAHTSVDWAWAEGAIDGGDHERLSKNVDNGVDLLVGVLRELSERRGADD